MPRLLAFLKYNAEHPDRLYGKQPLRPGDKIFTARCLQTSNYILENCRYGMAKGSDIPINQEIEKKVFTAVYNLLSVDKRWTKGALARYGGGKSCPNVADPDARCWCIVGALDLVKSKNWNLLGPHADRVYNKMNDAIRKVGFTCIEQFNDDPRVTHAHCMKFLDMVRKHYGYV